MCLTCWLLFCLLVVWFVVVLIPFVGLAFGDKFVGYLELCLLWCFVCLFGGVTCIEYMVVI